MYDLDSDAARSSKDTQRIQPKPKWDPYVDESTKEIEKRTEFDHDTLSQGKHDEVTDSSSTGIPVCGPESTKRCVLTPTKIEEDQTGTGDPSRWRSTTLISEYQDCHMQLWKKQNISEFNSLYTAS